MERIVIPDADLAVIRANAQLAEIGGKSSVRPYAERQANLATDQLVGQLCEAMVLFCTCSLDGYLAAREKANADRYSGDHGRDLIGLPVDIKGSLMRSGGKPADYRLIIRPRERRDRWVYVLALVECLQAPITVHVAGWTRVTDLPLADTDGPFRGAHTVWADDLKPVQKLQRIVRRFWERRIPDQKHAANH